jgi:hypothetical protein
VAIIEIYQVIMKRQINREIFCGVRVFSFFVLSYYVCLRSESRLVMYVTMAV